MRVLKTVNLGKEYFYFRNLCKINTKLGTIEKKLSWHECNFTKQTKETKFLINFQKNVKIEIVPKTLSV